MNTYTFESMHSRRTTNSSSKGTGSLWDLGPKKLTGLKMFRGVSRPTWPVLKSRVKCFGPRGPSHVIFWSQGSLDQGMSMYVYIEGYVYGPYVRIYTFLANLGAHQPVPLGYSLSLSSYIITRQGPRNPRLET